MLHNTDYDLCGTDFECANRLRANDILLQLPRKSAGNIHKKSDRYEEQQAVRGKCRTARCDRKPV